MGSRMKSLLLVLIICFNIGSARAQEVRTSPILLPVALGSPVAGANGSLWATELWVRNAGTDEVLLVRNCRVTCPEPLLLPAGAVMEKPPIFYGGYDAGPAAYLLVDAARVDQVQASLRIRDLSRAASTWGTELPVVRERDFRAGVVDLLDVALGTGFRQTLRIYSTAREAVPVEVRFYSMPRFGAGELLASRLVVLAPGAELFPAYAQLLDFASSIPELQGYERVHVQVKGSSAVPLWAFVSITHNESQHVTTVTPR